ncbi:hypothetical protein PILCRDRAFT_824279 [Piloderma croceum F 1598]|uniref:F-box domain-containing protein n=1 Tax=Piloderma croceum (strain F 1598) TaxID=765440 RepID=A0A0C3BMZ1_PILCF|nr:hypothetical protein PILCRDRAFT_824279 [Piloderma croceum F 1598]
MSPSYLHVGMFFSTPELVLHLCQVLADDDLLVLSQVSRHLNTLALQSFFIFHGMALSQISSEIFSISSLSLPAFGLALFVPPLTKLSCTFDANTVHADISALLRVLSRHTPIPELNLSIDMHTTNQEFLTRSDYKIVHGAVSQLLFGLGPHKKIFFLSPHGRFCVSKPRRMVHTIKYPEFPIDIDGIWQFTAMTPLICLYLLGYGFTNAAASVATVLYDPCIRSRQDERILEDIYASTNEFHNSNPGSVRITTPMLSSPSFTKWTMVTFAESSLKSLQIGHIPFLDDEKWHSILSSLYLPHLQLLNIKHNARISLTTLTAFINRHPTIQYLELGHYSISYSSSPQVALTLSPHCLDQLELVCASSHFIRHLLESTKFPKLRYICIGHSIQMNSKPFPDMRAKVEEPFDFAALDRALASVKDCGYSCGSVNIGVALPGGSGAKKWLARKHDPTLSAAGSSFKLHVSKMMIATERGIPLNPPMVPLLADWVVGMFLTHELKKVLLARWVITDPGLQAVFVNKITEVAGDVEVNFNIHRFGL